MPRAGAATEVVDRHRLHAGLGETQGQLLEERVQSAHIGQDHHPRPARLLRASRVGGHDLGAVGRGQGDGAGVAGGAPTWAEAAVGPPRRSRSAQPT